MATEQSASFAVLAARRAMSEDKSDSLTEPRRRAGQLARTPDTARDITSPKTSSKSSNWKGTITTRAASRNKGSKFLTLPRGIRYRIYRCIADISEGWISLDSGKDLVSHPEISFYNNVSSTAKKRARDALIRNLSRVCRVVNQDISRIVYAENFFHLGYSPSFKNPDHQLISLKKLRPQSILLLNYLVMQLNPYSMMGTAHPTLACSHHKHLNVLHQMQYCWKTTKWYTEKLSREHETIIDKWIQMAKYLAKHTKPYTLTLRFICDTDDFTMAQKATAPFFDGLKLRSCGMRLSYKPTPAFKVLAREASLCSMGLGSRNNDTESGRDQHIAAQRERKPPPLTSLMTLPKELRLLILSFSDLVTPLREVYFNIPRRFHLYFPPPGHRFSDRERNISKVCRHHSCKFRMCQPSVYSGCICRRWHGAFSLECLCWEPPVALFLVCKDMWLDALEIFYKHNRFIITPWAFNHSRIMDNYYMDIDFFLQTFSPRKALKFITYLQVALLPLEYLQLRPGTRMYNRWLKTIDFICENLTIQNLTLEICPWTEKEVIHEDTPAGFSFKDIKYYTTAFQPLRKLAGIKQFRLHVAPPGQRIPAHGTQVVQDIERLVLGDRYDSSESLAVKMSNMVGLRRLGRY